MFSDFVFGTLSTLKGVKKQCNVHLCKSCVISLGIGTPDLLAVEWEQTCFLSRVKTKSAQSRVNKSS